MKTAHPPPSTDVLEHARYLAESNPCLKGLLPGIDILPRRQLRKQVQVWEQFAAEHQVHSYQEERSAQ